MKIVRNKNLVFDHIAKCKATLAPLSALQFAQLAPENNHPGHMVPPTNMHFGLGQLIEATAHQAQGIPQNLARYELEHLAQIVIQQPLTRRKHPKN